MHVQNFVNADDFAEWLDGERSFLGMGGFFEGYMNQNWGQTAVAVDKKSHFVRQSRNQMDVMALENSIAKWAGHIFFDGGN